MDPPLEDVELFPVVQSPDGAVEDEERHEESAGERRGRRVLNWAAASKVGQTCARTTPSASGPHVEAVISVNSHARRFGSVTRDAYRAYGISKAALAIFRSLVRVGGSAGGLVANRAVSKDAIVLGSF